MSSSTLATDGESNVEAIHFSSWRTGKLLRAGNWQCCWRCQPLGLAGSPRYDYVLKSLNPALSIAERGRAAVRLSNRVMAYETIDHTGMIPIVDAELDRQPFFIVEPWVSGETVDRWVRSWPEVCVSRMMWVVRQVAEVIGAAHDQFRAHLNLRPDNILIDHQGRVSLTGWSLSTLAGLNIHSQGALLEPTRFAAPELSSNNYKLHLSADIYSLGALIHYLYSGRLPQPGTELRVHQTEAPFRLSRLLQAMTALDPKQRPDAKTVVDQLISIELDHLHNDRVVIWPDETPSLESVASRLS